jgi:uncharacterized membrane protein/heme-degrading monooxygenase HmoA
MGAAVQMLAGGVAVTLLGTVLGEWRAWHLSSRGVGAIAYLVVFGSIVGYSAYAYALRHASATIVGTYAYVNPVIAVLLGWLLLKEPVSARTFAAMGLILGAVVWIQLSHKLRRSAGEPVEPVTPSEARAEVAHAYSAYLGETGVADCRATPGNRGVQVLRRVVGDRAEFVFISFWESWEAIRGFAGPEVEVARYYPKDKQFLLRLEPKVEHYEVLSNSPSVTGIPA